MYFLCHTHFLITKCNEKWTLTFYKPSLLYVYVYFYFYFCFIGGSGLLVYAHPTITNNNLNVLFPLPPEV